VDGKIGNPVVQANFAIVSAALQANGVAAQSLARLGQLGRNASGRYAALFFAHLRHLGEARSVEGLADEWNATIVDYGRYVAFDLRLFVDVFQDAYTRYRTAFEVNRPSS
jgi:hypothetical protein